MIRPDQWKSNRHECQRRLHRTKKPTRPRPTVGMGGTSRLDGSDDGCTPSRSARGKMAQFTDSQMTSLKRRDCSLCERPFLNISSPCKEENYEPESRPWETRTSGSEGAGPGKPGLPTSIIPTRMNRPHQVIRTPRRPRMRGPRIQKKVRDHKRVGFFELSGQVAFADHVRRWFVAGPR